MCVGTGNTTLRISFQSIRNGICASLLRLYLLTYFSAFYLGPISFSSELEVRSSFVKKNDGFFIFKKRFAQPMARDRLGL
jgi:hypothetical protein